MSVGILATLLRRQRQPVDHRDAWETGVQHEVSFWDDWLATKGRAWPEDYMLRVDPKTELSRYHRAFVQHLPRTEIRILDVGAGPLTLLGKHLPGKHVTIVATDALAAQYDRLLEKHGVTPAVRTIAVETERLDEVFAENSFDLVNAQNCLDHSYDPLRAIAQMIRVARPGCFILLNHRVDEGVTESYQGLHQWNLTERQGSFVIWNASTTVNVTREVARKAVMELCAPAVVDYCGPPDHGWLRVHFRKRPARS